MPAARTGRPRTQCGRDVRAPKANSRSSCLLVSLSPCLLVSLSLCFLSLPPTGGSRARGTGTGTRTGAGRRTSRGSARGRPRDTGARPVKRPRRPFPPKRSVGSHLRGGIGWSTTRGRPGRTTSRRPGASRTPGPRHCRHSPTRRRAVPPRVVARPPADPLAKCRGRGCPAQRSTYVHRSAVEPGTIGIKRAARWPGRRIGNGNNPRPRRGAVPGAHR